MSRHRWRIRDALFMHMCVIGLLHSLFFEHILLWSIPSHQDPEHVLISRKFFHSTASPPLDRRSGFFKTMRADRYKIPLQGRSSRLKASRIHTRGRVKKTQVGDAQQSSFGFFRCGKDLENKSAKFDRKNAYFRVKKSKIQVKDIEVDKVPQFAAIPFADDQGIVLGYTRLNIANVEQPYNPSITKGSNGYLITFRNDRGKGLKRESTIASALLNTNFQQVGRTVFFHTSHTISEDPRIIDVRGQLFLLYCHVLQWDPYTTHMALTRFDQRTFSISNEIDLHYHPQIIEKNWVPFVHTDLSGTSLYFIYSFNPYKILRLSKSIPGGIEEPFPQSEKQNLTWEAKWGKICGGTPALIVGDEYLSFFHSSFWSKGIKWYVMGAYTFNKNPPFQIKRISKYPILFKMMYHTPMHPHVWFHPKQEFRVMFPCGFIESTEHGKNLMHLAYGENDSGLCILTLDKHLLLQSLQEFDLAKEK